MKSQQKGVIDMNNKGKITLGNEESKIYIKNGSINIEEPMTKTIRFDTDIYEISYIDVKNGVIHFTKKEQSE